LARRQNVAIGLAYLDSDQVRVVNAGAVAPFIRRGAETRMLDVGGVPLGSPLSGLTPYQEQTIDLRHGDLLVLITDGVVEATNAAGQLFGFERLTATIAAGPTESAAAMLGYLLNAVAAFVGQAEMHDDVTLVVVRRQMNDAIG
jgi:serine phosphatase RsbU (regulator of sigma subunit)